MGNGCICLGVFLKGYVKAQDGSINEEKVIQPTFFRDNAEGESKIKLRAVL